MLAPPEAWRRGIRILVRLPRDEPAGKGRPKSSYPAQSRMRGESLRVRTQATLSPPGNGQLRGAVRSYLERPEARPDVLQNAPIEAWLDRWSIWISPNESDIDRFTVARVVSEELVRRHGEHGLTENDIYVVAHEKDGKLHDIHAVIPAPFGLDITRSEMRAIGNRIVRELSLERNLERALDRSRNSDETRATSAQMAVLRGHGGQIPTDLTRREASMLIQELIRGRDLELER